MAVAASEKLYEVHVEGQYRALQGDSVRLKPYTLTFIADQIMREAGLLHCFRKALMSQGTAEENPVLLMMKKKYPDYKRFRTHEISRVVDMTTGAQVKELALMNRRQLVRLIESKNFAIDCTLYATVSDLRQAIKEYRSDPELFHKMQEKRRVLRGPSIHLTMRMAELNRSRVAGKNDDNDSSSDGGSGMVDSEGHSNTMAGRPPVQDSEVAIPEFSGIQDIDEQKFLDDLANGI